MGVDKKHCETHALPGNRKGYVGYYIDDGSIVDVEKPTKKVEYEGKSHISYIGKCTESK